MAGDVSPEDLKRKTHRKVGFTREDGAPGEIRTPDHQVRSLVLYPTELRALCRGLRGLPAVERGIIRAYGKFVKAHCACNVENGKN